MSPDYRSVESIIAMVYYARVVLHYIMKVCCCVQYRFLFACITVIILILVSVSALGCEGGGVMHATSGSVMPTRERLV